MCIQFHIPRGEYWITKYFRTYLFLVINLGVSLNLGRKANIFHLWYLLGIKLINYWFNFTTDSRKIVSLYTGHTWLSISYISLPIDLGKSPIYLSSLTCSHRQAILIKLEGYSIRCWPWLSAEVWYPGSRGSRRAAQPWCCTACGLTETSLIWVPGIHRAWVVLPALFALQSSSRALTKRNSWRTNNWKK